MAGVGVLACLLGCHIEHGNLLPSLTSRRGDKGVVAESGEQICPHAGGEQAGNDFRRKNALQVGWGGCQI